MTKAKAKPEVTEEVAAPVELISIKAFDADMKCRGYQFEVGGTYTAVGKVTACRNGFHAIDETDDPFHVWDFYPIIGDDGRLTRYAEVAQTGELDREKEKRGTKIASASITVKAELSLPAFIRRGVQALIKSTMGKEGASSGDYATNASSGHYATNASSGDYATNASSGHSATNASSGHSAKNASSGDYAKNASSGDYAKNASSGDSATNASSGDSATNASSGDYAKNASSGDYATNASSGHSATNASSGDSATNASSGDYAKNEAKGANSVIACAGAFSQARGVDGTWISLAEYDSSYPTKCIGFATGCVGQDGIPADTWLVARGGKLVAA